MLEKKLGFLMNSLLKKTSDNETSNTTQNENNRSKSFLYKKYKGILPQGYAEILNAGNNAKSTTTSNDPPLSAKEHLSKQSTLRQNLITEVDINNISKKQNN